MKLIAAVTLIASAILAATPALAATKVISGVGLEGSEAARYDPVANRIIVANLGARGPEENGFVTIMSPDGAVQTVQWIAGGVNGATLRDPLGVIVGPDTIYVADVASVHKFDRATGEPAGVIAVSDAVRLNDMALAKDGTLYVTDSGSDDAPGALYRISPAGKVSVFAARDQALERPNGVAVMPDGNIVHGGRGVNLVFRTPQGKIIREQSLPTGRMDGIVALADGALLVASQDGHNVYRVPAGGGKPVVVASDIEIPAAIGFDTKRNRLIIPQIKAASITLVDLP
jgi:sugar lactone lactonase YvrE